MKFVFGTTLALGSMAATAWAGTSVSVSGSVKNPGSIAVSRAQTLREAVKASGGFGAYADLSRIQVTDSDGRVRTVDLTQLGRHPMVQPGEQIFVPEIDRSTHAIVRGGVAYEGAYEVKPGMTVADVLKQAGASSKANLAAVRVQRVGTDGTVNVNDPNLLAMKLRPGDTVIAPYIGQRNSDRDLLTIALVGLILIVLFD